MTIALNTPFVERCLIGTALEWLEHGSSVALVTLINIDGNAPYPIGSQMLVDQHGRFVGQISGGCAESAIADQAVTAIESGELLTQRYGLDSPFFDIQLPCGSGIDVLIDPTLDSESCNAILQHIESRQTTSVTYRSELGKFTRHYFPPLRVVSFGQGPILISLAQIAQLSGYESHLIAQDEATLSSLQQDGLQATLMTSKHDIGSLCDEFTAVVSLFHEHEHETDLLQQALASQAFYVGALGSKRTHQNRVVQLQSKGVAESDIARIRGPVGLDIGASTPAEIAISILAEVIQISQMVSQ